QRNSGYADTVSAMAELIDNCFDAEAKNVKIIFIEEKQDNKDKIVEILICDDGVGMDQDTLNTALRFGGGLSNQMEERVAISKRRLGKFGFGLPNASISQCETVNVYTWQNSSGQGLKTFLDIPSLIRDRSIYLPAPETVPLSPYFDPYKAVCDENHGTIISWTNLDRLTFSTVKTHIKHLKWRLGRSFRHLINDKKASVTFHHYIRQENNIEDITPPNNALVAIDPLGLMKNTQASELIWKVANSDEIPGVSDCYKKFAISPTEHHPTSQKVDAYTYPFRFKWGNKTLTFEITASHAKIDIQKPGVREGGNQGIGKQFYKKMYDNNGNISFVRADREIQSGWFEMYNRSVTENRFWGIEIKFNQDADDLMGVTNNKQGTQFKFHSIDPEDGGSEDDGNIPRGRELLFSKLSLELYQVATELSKLTKKAAKTWASDNEVPDKPWSVPSQVKGTGDIIELVERLRKDPLSKEEKERLSRELRLRYPNLKDEDHRFMVDKLDDNMTKACILYTESLSETLWTHSKYQDLLLILVNSNHQFYEKFIEPMRTKKQLNELTAFELLIHAFAKNEQMMSVDRSFEGAEQILQQHRRLSTISLERYLNKIPDAENEDGV
ncbi:MAG: ATP-binding protein, partial [Burkholderiales bacterium]|nr:ATP-binding protein [Burkholderiales bacterium]